VKKRPGSLTFLLVLFIVLGALGVLVAIASPPAYFKDRMQVMDDADPSKSFVGKTFRQEKNEEIVRVQREMAGAIYDKTIGSRPWSIASYFLNMVLSGLLLVFAIGVFRRREAARKGLFIVCLLHLPFEWIRFGLLCHISSATADALVEWIPKIGGAQGSPELVVPTVGGTDVGEIAGFVMIGLYALTAFGLSALYSIAAVYLQKDKVRSVCNE